MDNFLLLQSYIFDADDFLYFEIRFGIVWSGAFQFIVNVAPEPVKILIKC